MELANKVMAVATPALRSPESVRLGESVRRSSRRRVDGRLGEAVADEVAAMQDALPGGSLGVVAPDS